MAQEGERRYTWDQPIGNVYGFGVRGWIGTAVEAEVFTGACAS
jgi:hypothetical protein